MALTTQTVPTESDTKQLEAIFAEVEEVQESLIPLLQEIQTRYHYLPEFALRRVAAKLGVPVTDVYQVATFYSCFSLEPVGKHVVQVCLGTACHVRGAPRVLDRMLRDLKLSAPGTTADMQFTVRSVRCVGCCGLAPVVRVDNNTHPNLTQAKVRGMLKKYQSKEARPAESTDEAANAEARINP
ncbi:MAG: NAD(P)H-dependent oxidoreductase subunit E [Acidobacteria bacterium]|nr:NAD(P)H-dependent oxidoreductase subunit E [Acidobacteriota bacterium]MCL5286748.1 NAD(P)H-dependent oxidoreductase subunit E [Acidobacteriota bacterium]